MVTGASLVLWLATGAAIFTRIYDPALERHRQSEREIDRLFAEAGAETQEGPIDRAPNKFQLGLLPSTAPWHIWDRHVLSVLTPAGPALLVAMVYLRTHRQKTGRQTAPH